MGPHWSTKECLLVVTKREEPQHPSLGNGNIKRAHEGVPSEADLMSQTFGSKNVMLTFVKVMNSMRFIALYLLHTF